MAEPEAAMSERQFKKMNRTPPAQIIELKSPSSRRIRMPARCPHIASTENLEKRSKAGELRGR